MTVAASRIPLSNNDKATITLVKGVRESVRPYLQAPSSNMAVSKLGRAIRHSLGSKPSPFGVGI